MKIHVKYVIIISVLIFFFGFLLNDYWRNNIPDNKGINMNDSSPKKSKSLPPPPIADTINDSKEVLRVWAAPNSPQQFTLDTTWKDPGAWGLLLVDVARHASKAYKKEGYDEKEALNRIKLLFDAEWSSPTDDPKDISTQ